MNPLLLNIGMFGIMITLLLTGAPLYSVIGAVGIVFGILIGGTDILPMFAMRVFAMMMSYSLVSVPLFILMANMLQQSGIVEEMFEAMFQWSGKVRGSIALATIVTGIILAAMIGVVGASVIALGLLAIPAMMKRNYNKHLLLGTVCAAGTLGILIPPSIMPIFYSAATQVSVIDLFAGSILPGLFLGIIFCVYIIILVWIKPDYAPAIKDEERIIGFWKKAALGKHMIAPVIIIACVMGTILAGIASPTEAAGVGVFAVMVLMVLRKKLTKAVMRQSLKSTISATGMALWITFASTIFVGVYAMGDGQEVINKMVLSLPGGKWGALIFTQFIYIILGMFLDWIGICLLIVPIFSPILVQLGFDPVHVGIIFMVNMQLSFISPPFGYALFFVKGIIPSEITMGDIWWAAIPFLVLQLLVLILCSIFPEISMFIPSMLQ